MFFKKKRFNAFLLLSLVFLFFASSRAQETVDCVAAVVNDQVITLVDLKIALAFGLLEKEIVANAENPLRLVLEKLIDQKVVIDLTREKISVEEEEVEANLKDIREKIGQDRMQMKLGDFDLDLNYLKGYLREKLLYQKIISLRFGQSVIVSLKEIETYYQDVYIPSQKKLGLEPKLIVQVLDEIEARVKGEKMERQVALWIENLRRQAEIEIRDDCLGKKSGIED